MKNGISCEFFWFWMGGGGAVKKISWCFLFDRKEGEGHALSLSRPHTQKMPNEKLRALNAYSSRNAPVGEDASQFAQFAGSAACCPRFMSWTPTVVNPATEGTMLDRAMFWVHILSWVFGLVFSATAGFSTLSDGTGLWEGYAPALDGMKVIGISGTISTLFGVVGILAVCSCYDSQEYSQMIRANTAIQFFTLYGTSSAFYIFGVAASKTDTAVYFFSLFGLIFLVYAQVLLYCTSAALGVRALPRSFIPTMAGSVQLVSAIAISTNDFRPSLSPEFSNEQKFVAWAIPILTILAVSLMIFLRQFTRETKLVKSGASISELHEYPFLRSVVLMPFVVSGILSVYKMSFIAVGSNSVAYIFAFFGMLLNFSIITVVFIPNGGAFGEDLLMVDRAQIQPYQSFDAPAETAPMRGSFA